MPPYHLGDCRTPASANSTRRSTPLERAAEDRDPRCQRRRRSAVCAVARATAATPSSSRGSGCSAPFALERRRSGGCTPHPLKLDRDDLDSLTRAAPRDRRTGRFAGGLRAPGGARPVFTTSLQEGPRPRRYPLGGMDTASRYFGPVFHHFAAGRRRRRADQHRRDQRRREGQLRRGAARRNRDRDAPGQRHDGRTRHRRGGPLLPARRFASGSGMSWRRCPGSRRRRSAASCSKSAAR